MSSTAVRPLPKGPHGLSSDEVVASQRERIFAAVIDAVAEKGYVHTSVADVLGRAKVSRLTFYQLFRDKQECFVSAFEGAGVAPVSGARVGPRPGVATNCN